MNDDQFVGRTIENTLESLVRVINPFLEDKTGIPNLLSVTSYSITDNCGVNHSNLYWTNPDTSIWHEDPSHTVQWFWRETANANYKTDKPRDILRWIAELFGGFITVNRNGRFEMRQFCQPSLNIAQIHDTVIEADSKCINWFVMGFAIAVEFGLELLGQYYHCDELSEFTGAIAAGTVFFILMMMETISVFENFAIANPDSPLSKIVGKRLKKIQDQIVKKEEPHDENSQN